jgi:multicomponent Na+:H+ antiporter subunit E
MAPERQSSVGFVLLWILLAFVWFAANSSLAPEALVTGIVASGVLAYTFARASDAWGSVSFSLNRLRHFLIYTGIFAVELVRANLNMTRHVFSRRIDINPGVVQIKTRLKTPLGRLALANSIALTPGSLVLDMEGESLFIHWLDVRTTDSGEATRLIAGPFEEHLEQTFG